MHFSHQILLVLGVSNLAYAATNVVFYAAYDGRNPDNGSRSCPGLKVGDVRQSGKGKN
jgi:hypothetical protein